MSLLIVVILDTTLALALALTGLRLARGPTLANRVAALDLMAVLLVALAAVHASHDGGSALLDVSLVVGLIAFVATAAFAVLIGRRHPTPPPGTAP
ncbi:MAG: monovalent cation/H+ antiporter complex subunit F [Planctomycetota bacterium]|jgi:multicomponent Na+:H+ antiporter subunit F